MSPKPYQAIRQSALSSSGRDVFHIANSIPAKPQLDQIREESVEKENVLGKEGITKSEHGSKLNQPKSDRWPEKTSTWKWSDVMWHNVILIALLHVGAVHGLWLYISGAVKVQSMVICFLFGAFSAFGVTAGAHRYWAHRSFKAKWPLRLFLAFCNTCALETNIYDWCRDHSVHHSHVDTNADPHNSNRGFFFAHVGWLLLKKHPDVLEKGSRNDFSGLLKDPLVRYQRQYYLPLGLFCWGVLPTALAVFLFDERPLYAFMFCVIFRYVYVLHVTWSVNSFAHLHGNRPYNIKINPRENKMVTYLSFGEGYHNYHHTFPWDYSASEFGLTNCFNLSTALIDACAKIGWAYDLKKPSLAVVKGRMKSSGDQTSAGNVTIWQTIFDWILGMFIVFFLPICAISLRIIYTHVLYNVAW